MARKRHKHRNSGELKGIKAPNNKGVAYLPSAKTITKKQHRPALHGGQRYPSGLAQVKHDEETNTI